MNARLVYTTVALGALLVAAIDKPRDVPAVCLYVTDANGGVWVAGSGDDAASAVQGAVMPRGAVTARFGDCD